MLHDWIHGFAFCPKDTYTCFENIRGTRKSPREINFTRQLILWDFKKIHFGAEIHLFLLMFCLGRSEKEGSEGSYQMLSYWSHGFEFRPKDTYTYFENIRDTRKSPSEIHFTRQLILWHLSKTGFSVASYPYQTFIKNEWKPTKYRYFKIFEKFIFESRVCFYMVSDVS